MDDQGKSEASVMSNQASFMNPSWQQIDRILAESKTIAVIGLSDKEDRPSYMVSAAMQDAGYKIIPINPARTAILGEACYASLQEVPDDIKIDIVNVFRRSDQTLESAQQAVAVGAKVLWLQQGVHNEETASIALAGGLEVIMDRCIKVEHALRGRPRG
jgi:predicted CoA-binding protein